MAQDTAIYKEMFDNCLHIGHRTQRWNPKMKKFIYGEKNGIHIINLEKTFDLFTKAMNFLKEMKNSNKTVLFVSTKPQAVIVLEETAKACKMPYVISKWIPGLLTNYSTLKDRIKYLADLKRQEETGEFDKYTKKEVSKFKKTIQKLETALGGVQEIKKVPDAIFVLDIYRDKIPVQEAKKIGIPVIAIVDTNADPDMVDYPIPANDDNLKSFTYILENVKNVFKKAAK